MAWKCAGINRRGAVNERVIRERSSDPSWPRVMRGQPRGCHRSVDRGTCRQGMELRNNRKTQSVPAEAAGRLEKALSLKSNMYAGGESDGCVIPSKCPNNGGQPPAVGMEGRQPSKENIGQATSPRTQRP